MILASNSLFCMNVLPYIIRWCHLPVLISRSSSTRKTFVQTWRPGPLQNVEDGNSLWFLRQRCIISNFVWPQIDSEVSVLASLPASVSKGICKMYHGISSYKWNLLKHKCLKINVISHKDKINSNFNKKFLILEFKKIIPLLVPNGISRPVASAKHCMVY